MSSTRSRSWLCNCFSFNTNVTEPRPSGSGGAIFSLVPIAAALLLLPACSRKSEPFQVFNTVPGFTLTAQSGRPFESIRELAGRVWIADFIYTSCPGPCPRMSRQMKQIQTALESEPDIRLVSFTIEDRKSVV